MTVGLTRNRALNFRAMQINRPLPPRRHSIERPIPRIREQAQRIAQRRYTLNENVPGPSGIVPHGNATEFRIPQIPVQPQRVAERRSNLVNPSPADVNYDIDIEMSDQNEPGPSGIPSKKPKLMIRGNSLTKPFTRKGRRNSLALSSTVAASVGQSNDLTGKKIRIWI